MEFKLVHYVLYGCKVVGPTDPTMPLDQEFRTDMHRSNQASNKKKVHLEIDELKLHFTPMVTAN